MNTASYAHETADIAPSAVIGTGTKLWHYSQVRENAKIGENCIVGRGAYVGPGVEVGDNCKIQNYALVYEPARLASGVFIGPAVVLTNDHFPRAINEDGTPKSAEDWEPVGVTILEGASIGASATCVAPITIGRWALVGSGSVVISDVPDYAVVVGSPAKRVGWVGPAGRPLAPREEGFWECPITGALFHEQSRNSLIELEKE